MAAATSSSSALGGATSELYDPVKDAWSAVPKLDLAVMAITLLADGRPLAVGYEEVRTDVRTLEPMARADVLDLATFRWSELSVPSADSIALLPSGRLALGGAWELPGVTKSDGSWERFGDGEATSLLSVSPKGDVRYFGLVNPLAGPGQSLGSFRFSADKGFAASDDLRVPLASIRAAYLDEALHVMLLGSNRDGPALFTQ